MVGDGDVRAETEQVMKNIGAVLRAAGGDYSNVVKGTIFLTDLADFHHVGEIYGACFSEGAPPARSCVQVSALPRGAVVEIEIIAHLQS
jgi:2-iminobutanoate/2-iminopropanoate deaminase